MKPWNRPQNYVGPNWNNYYILYSINRDSDLIEKTNWQTFNEIISPFLGMERQEVEGDESGGEIIETVRDSHWACGWVKTLLIHKSAPTDLLDKANKTLERLEDYPLLNEDLFCQMEYEEAQETWFNLPQRCKIRLLKELNFPFPNLACKWGFDAIASKDESGEFRQRLTSN